MYYRLKDAFILRGWEKVNAVIIQRPHNRYKPLSEAQFRLLLLCDGETDFDAIPSSEVQQAMLDRFIHAKVVEKVTKPTPLSEDQIYRFYPNRFVPSCFWSITGRCNYRCRHCYMDAPNGAFGELSHEEAINLIHQMADCGVLKVDITGGEPLIRADFWELADELTAHHIAIETIYTNGHSLTDAVLTQFKQRGLTPAFSISFDGFGRHDWMRGIPGAEEAALAAFARCKQRGFATGAEMCIHRGNADTLRETVNRLAKLGVSSLKCCNVAETPLWQKNSQGNSFTLPEYVEAMLAYIPQFFADGAPMNLLLCNVAQFYKNSTAYQVAAEKFDGTVNCLDAYLCGAARASCYITPEGRLLPCMPMIFSNRQKQFPKFQDIGLRRGLSDSFYMQYIDQRIQDLLNVNEKCSACPHKLYCGGGCRAAALEQSGDLLGSDAEQCFLWENDYVEKIRQVTDAAIARYRKKK